MVLTTSLFYVQLPSKKIVPIFLACALAGGGIVYAATYQAPIEQNPHLIVESSQTQTPSLSDDGTWKKTLATVVPASATTTDDTSTSTGVSATTTVTENISKELLSSYLAQTQNGGQVTPDFENDLVNQLVDQTSNAAASSTATVYTSSDIKISDDNSIAALHAYGNAVGKAIQDNASGATTTELIIYSDAAENNDPQSVSAILPIIESYQKTLGAFLAISVPSSATNIHLALINSYSQIIAIDEMLMKFPTDPVTSIYGLQEYQTGSVAVYNSIEAYPVFFKSQGVTFSQGDAGLVFSDLGK